MGAMSTELERVQCHLGNSDDPGLQELLRVVEQATTLSQLMVLSWDPDVDLFTALVTGA